MSLEEDAIFTCIHATKQLQIFISHGCKVSTCYKYMLKQIAIHRVQIGYQSIIAKQILLHMGSCQ